MKKLLLKFLQFQKTELTQEFMLEETKQLIMGEF